MFPYNDEEIAWLSECTLCPRKCRANRFSNKPGFCNSGADFAISSICCHLGEEPVISGEKGICNVFFSRCNLQCNFCQNHDISRNSGNIIRKSLSNDEVIRRICEMLDRTENCLGFVSPSHQIPQMMAIIRGLHEAGKHPVIVYNTNGYDRLETLKLLEGIVDIYLPDFKYTDQKLALDYSQAENYPEIAKAALKEMYRQKGATLLLDDNNMAISGIIIRHLVLPGAVKQSIDTLRYIAEEISPGMHISLMSQYYPTALVKGHPELSRTLTTYEFGKVTEAFHALGFYRGWIQEMDSHAVFRPDFRKEQPF
jgi:putative pyruvate formate lyase activating enzyme